jgi:hypothetical protein
MHSIKWIFSQTYQLRKGQKSIFHINNMSQFKDYVENFKRKGIDWKASSAENAHVLRLTLDDKFWYQSK